MPERYRIAYEDANVDPARSVRYFHFWVRRNDGPRRHLRVAVPVTATEEDLPILSLERLELELRTTGSSLFAPDGDSSEILLWTDDIEAARAARGTPKECVWLDERPREWTCLAHAGPASDKTNPRLCAGCTVPDERIICTHLMKPGVMLHESAAGPRARSVSSSPGCMIGESPGNGSECRVGGKDCWERVVEAQSASPLDPPADVARSVADELDFLRLVARDRLALTDAVPLPQARSISELFGRCDSAEDLQRRVATLGDLLNRFDFIDALDPVDQVDGDGQRLPSLAALDKLLDVRQTGVSGAGGPVSVLRAIVRVRNTFPVHTQGGRTRENFRDLGIDYPPRDWHAAWTTILISFWSSLRRLREALQTV